MLNEWGNRACTDITSYSALITLLQLAECVDFNSIGFVLMRNNVYEVF